MNKEIENISALELSHKEIDLDNFKESVLRTIDENSRGKRGRRVLIDNLDPEAMRQIRLMERQEKVRESINVEEFDMRGMQE